MERMMKSMGQEVPQQSRVLELNPNHTLTKKLQAWQSNEEYQKAFENLTKYAYNQALFLEGGEISDPKQFIASIEQLLQ
jgi:molecular chaperone HtpG